MAWYEIPNTNAVSIYAALLFGVLTIIFVFRLWLKATCGRFESKVSSKYHLKNVLEDQKIFFDSRFEWKARLFSLLVLIGRHCLKSYSYYAIIIIKKIIFINFLVASVKKPLAIWQNAVRESLWHAVRWKLLLKLEVSDFLKLS